jgi:hypothetical protein
MAVDTPAKIAIIGAGPIGLEAALYARFLGYDVEVFTTGNEVCQRITDKWETLPDAAESPLLTPFNMVCSPLGLKAIASQYCDHQFPDGNARLTPSEWRELYLKPLSATDLLDGCIQYGASVIHVGKVEIHKTDCPAGEFDRGAWDFRILAHDPRTLLCSMSTADVVLDCSGVSHARGWVGHGGIPALGEFDIQGMTRIHWPTKIRAERDVYQGTAILVVGDDLQAARSVVDLAELRQEEPSTQIHWLTRFSRDQRPEGPIVLTDNDLPSRRQIFETANKLAMSSHVDWRPGAWVEQLSWRDDDRVAVAFVGDIEGELVVDHVVCPTHSRPNWFYARELQLDICPITDAPRPFSRYLLQRPSPYSVEYPAPTATALITSEPNYYVLGSKSFGRMPGFLYQHGLRQIRDVFTIIGDRAELDLYA